MKLVWILVLSCLLPGLATAAPTVDDWTLGTRHYDLREYAQAAARFRSGYLDTGELRYLRRLGDCNAALGDDAGALAAYRQYLQLAPAAPDHAEVEGEIALIERLMRHSLPSPQPLAPPPAKKDRPLYKSAWLWTGASLATVVTVLGLGLGLGLPQEPVSCDRPSCSGAILISPALTAH